VVEVEGADIAELYPLLTEVTVRCDRSGAWTGRLRFDSYRDGRGRWAVEDSPYFTPWDRVRISAHFGSHREEVLSGFVRQLTADHPGEQGRSSVTVECQDTSLMMDREQVRRSWGEEEAPTTDGMILAEILNAYPGLVPAPGSGTGLSGLRGINQNETDVQFLRRRAEANGYELMVGPSTVYFGPMRLDGDLQPTILVYAGDAANCLSCSVTADGHAPDAVGFDVADPSDQTSRRVVVTPEGSVLGREPASSAGRALKDFVWQLSREGAADEEELRAKAQRRADELSMQVKAEGELDGAAYAHVLRVGEPVLLDGIGERFSGRYYVDTVDHRFSPNGYRQRFRLLRNAVGELPSTFAGPLGRVV
jgi:phage protein D